MVSRREGRPSGTIFITVNNLDFPEGANELLGVREVHAKTSPIHTISVRYNYRLLVIVRAQNPTSSLHMLEHSHSELYHHKTTSDLVSRAETSGLHGRAPRFYYSVWNRYKHGTQV